MNNIRFETGIKEYCINDDESRVIRINIADPNLIARVQEVKDLPDEIRERFGGKDDLNLEEMVEADKIARERLTEAFGTDICSIAFGNVSCFARVSDDKIILQTFLDALMEQIMKDFNALAAARKIDLSEKADKYISRVKGPAKVLTEEQKEFLRSLLESENG